MSIIDKIAAVFLSFLISLFGAVAAICAIMSNTMSDPDFMIKVLEKRHYYDSIFIEYCDSVESLALPAGMEDGVFSSLVTKEEFVNDINSVIKSAYGNSSGYAGAAIDYDTIYTRFYSAMSDFAVSEGYDIYEDLAEGIDNVAGLCASTYEVYVTVPFIDTIGSYASEFDNYFKIAAIVSAIFLIFFILLIARTKKWRDICGKLITISVITVGLLLSLAPLAILLSGKVRYLNITTRSLYAFAVGYCEHILYTFLYCGIGLILLTVVVYVSIYLYKRFSSN